MRNNDSATDLTTEAPAITGRDAAAWISFGIEVGIDLDPEHLQRVADAAVEAGAAPVLADLACDPREPMVARLRALGRIAAHLR